MIEQNLPKWDLSDFYPSQDCDELEADKNNLKLMADSFAQKYRGKISELSASELYQSIVEYAVLSDLSAKICSYSDLLFATQTTDAKIAKIYQDIGDLASDCASEVVFFVLEINLLPQQKIDKMLRDDEQLQYFAPWLRDVRAGVKHQLSEDLEKLLLEKHGVANSAWLRLYEDICNRMQLKIDGKELNLTGALDFLSNKDEQKRKDAAQSISVALNEKLENFSLIFNVIMKDKQINDAWRKFPRSVSSRNLDNLVEDEIVDMLAGSVRANYGNLSERYYLWKAKQLGKDSLDFWDRNAPLPSDDDENFTWNEAKEVVLESYREFSPKMAEVAMPFFTNDWIDVPVYAGKTSGAFAHPCSTSLHPYLLLNFQGKMRDVMTLAHELGHGVHQILASKKGALMSGTPLTLAETASVFGEQLTFRYLLNNEKSAARRKNLIASKVEDMLSTVVRQIAFYEFETECHLQRKEGELTAEQISDIWINTQAESFGKSVKLGEAYRPFWAYISHFFHSPFYVYAYAFGDCLVNSLYAIYESEKAAGNAAIFEEKYIEMLKAGGALRHKELLAPFGIDIAKEDFWQAGLNYIAKLIDLLEDM